MSVLADLPGREADKIIRLIKMFADDPRPEKVDLGVGVYRTETGKTPIFAAVKSAEAQLLQEQQTKGYVALDGDPTFRDAMRRLVLGDAVVTERVATAATPGGTGALRQAFEMLRMARPDATVWTSDPTWPNHPSILDTLGLRRRSYRYIDRASGGMNRAGMMADLDQAQPGDVVLLHGCCHNPTGIDPTLQDWRDLTALLASKNAVPLIDLAYQGFGDGLEEDVAGLSQMAGAVPECIVTVSGSKNFGLYRERVGAVLAICPDADVAEKANAVLSWLNRQSFAFPPDHGARIVTMILNDPALRRDWEGELEAMRQRISANRLALASALRDLLGSDRFGFLQGQRGMFSLLGGSPEKIERLRTEEGLYIVGDGRVNLAGLTAANLEHTAEAIARVLK